MSHVDEGQLHAYLDGGLSAMDAVRVERHLAECGSCRARLEEARGLVSRAAKLLEWTTPPERAMPPLSDLQPAAPRWRTPVAWAATIVIALGVGVYGGGQLLNRQRSDRQEKETAARASTTPAQTEARNQVTAPAIVATVDSTRSLRDAERSGALAPGPQDLAARSTLAEEQPGRRELDSLAKRRVDSLGRTAAAAEPLVAVEGAIGRRDTSPAAPPVETRDQPRQLAPAPAPVAAARPAAESTLARLEAVTVSGAAESRERRFAPITTSWPVISRDSASRLLRGPLVALPDLPINAVRSQGDAIIVEHVVPPGQVIRLLERRAAAGDEAAGAARDRAAKTSNEALARYVGGLRVEISGPLPADSLSKLLDRVRVIP